MRVAENNRRGIDCRSTLSWTSPWRTRRVSGSCRKMTVRHTYDGKWLCYQGLPPIQTSQPKQRPFLRSWQTSPASREEGMSVQLVPRVGRVRPHRPLFLHAGGARRRHAVTPRKMSLYTRRCFCHTLATLGMSEQNVKHNVGHRAGDTHGSAKLCSVDLLFNHRSH